MRHRIAVNKRASAKFHKPDHQVTHNPIRLLLHLHNDKYGRGEHDPVSETWPDNMC